MNPCVKATWSRVNHTPVVPFRNRHHRKISALGALALSAKDQRIELLIDWHPDSYVRAEQAMGFVQRLLKQLPTGPITLVWDKLQAHRSLLLKKILALHPRLSVIYLPSYAPDLNPVETLWCLTKYHRMANHGLDTLEALFNEARRHIGDVASDPALLRACFASAGLRLAPT